MKSPWSFVFEFFFQARSNPTDTFRVERQKKRLAHMHANDRGKKVLEDVQAFHNIYLLFTQITLDHPKGLTFHTTNTTYYFTGLRHVTSYI